ncbi:uncharacterized protein LOC126190658 [Schistocerca cancellata]|uniref:uncharacterized protein LOC126190658 n=1 Tax=Schistocerca cancellata TaxID=274614 RepID=UPI0021186641|nr:uncharacterized protein LOC126190658 [Schistocerca cancellata]
MTTWVPPRCWAMYRCSCPPPKPDFTSRECAPRFASSSADAFAQRPSRLPPGILLCAHADAHLDATPHHHRDGPDGMASAPQQPRRPPDEGEDEEERQGPPRGGAGVAGGCGSRECCELKREIKELEGKTDSLGAEVVDLRRQLATKEQQVLRLQREVHKLKVGAQLLASFSNLTLLTGSFSRSR